MLDIEGKSRAIDIEGLLLSAIRRAIPSGVFILSYLNVSSTDKLWCVGPFTFAETGPIVFCCAFSAL